MVEFSKFTLLYEKYGSKSFSPFALAELLKLQFKNQSTDTAEPLAMVIEGMDRMLYYNIHDLQIYAKREITFEELFERNWCHGLYRNNKEIIVESNRVEAGSLWLLRARELFLVSEDEFVSWNLDDSPHNFKKIF